SVDLVSSWSGQSWSNVYLNDSFADSPLRAVGQLPAMRSHLDASAVSPIKRSSCILHEERAVAGDVRLTLEDARIYLLIDFGNSSGLSGPDPSACFLSAP